MTTDITTVILSVLQLTLDSAEIPNVQMGRRYLRAFLAGEKYAAPMFRPAAVENARLSMLILGVGSIRLERDVACGIVDYLERIEVYIKTQKET